MRRGVYFDGWYPNQHNYHPSLPMRKLKMIDDLTEMGGTTLVWSAMGGGSISLAYLEQEAYQEIPGRLRLYGHLNDAEFIAHCRERGIEVFGVVFEAQGWEFPAEYDKDHRLLALNELRGVGEPGWAGLREFTKSTGPQDWAPFEKYFPDGLTNSLGEPVTDIWEEACCRDLDGQPLLTDWVICPDREHICHFMDRNNPVWREYLKAIIRIQIDAGVAGVQLDESETPLGAFGYGGCFCKDCMAGFREYLQGLEADQLPDELAGTDLTSFDYAQYLRDHGVKAQTPVKVLPMGRLYAHYAVESTRKHFAEIAGYIKEYGRSQGREVLVGGNFYNGNPEFDPLVDCVDVMITEMASTQHAQPGWFRYVEGMARGRDVLVAENPYHGVIPGMITAINDGKQYDRLRCSLYEGAAMGPSMTFPYGSWMGSVTEDAFWAPPALLKEVGAAILATDHLRGHVSANEVAVLYPVADGNDGEFDGPRWGYAADHIAYDALIDDLRVTYWPVINAIAGADIPVDSIPLPGADARPNDVTAAGLARYRYVVLPDCRTVSPEQHAELMGYAHGGGQVIVVGEYGLNLGATADQLRSLATVIKRGESVVDLIEDRQLTLSDATELCVNTVDLGDRAALHLLNFAFDEQSDHFTPHRDTTVSIRLAQPVHRAVLHRPGRESAELDLTVTDDRVTFTLDQIDIYAVVELIGA